MNRFACHFFERRHASRDLDQAAAAQCDHAALNRLLLQFHCRGAHQNQFPNMSAKKALLTEC